ncbi:hypothetical protein ACTFIT_003023 [Dictyostelium discoideum]
MYLLSTVYWFNFYFSNYNSGTTPSTSTTTPSTEIPILSPGSNSELNYKGEQIKLYTFDKWIFTPLDNNKNLYETSFDVNSNTITNISTTIKQGLIKVLL